MTSGAVVSYNANGFDLRDYGYTDELNSKVSGSAKLTHLLMAFHEDVMGTEAVKDGFVFSKSGWTTTFMGVTMDSTMNASYLVNGGMPDMHTVVAATDGMKVMCNINSWWHHEVVSLGEDKTAWVNDEIHFTMERLMADFFGPVDLTGTSFYCTQEVVRNVDVTTLQKLGESMRDNFTCSFDKAGVYFVCAYREGVPHPDLPDYMADPYGTTIYWCKVTVSSHKVTWSVDGNDTVEEYAPGDNPVFAGSTDKPADDKYTYTFAGWDSEIEQVSGDVTYTALYDPAAKSYDVVFTSAGAEVSRASVAYGSEIVRPADPVREGYTFNGWSPDNVETVPVGGVTFEAQWTVKAVVKQNDVKVEGDGNSVKVVKEVMQTAGNKPVTVSGNGWEVELPSSFVTKTQSDVTIAVSKTSVAGLSEAARKSVPEDAVVYSITSSVPLGGSKVKVTLPYTLPDDKTPSSVMVWCVKEDGSLEPFEATYSDGKVTFETTHFSDWAVGTQEEPAESGISNFAVLLLVLGASAVIVFGAAMVVSRRS